MVRNTNSEVLERFVLTLKSSSFNPTDGPEKIQLKDHPIRA